MTNPLYTELADETSSSSDSSVTDWFVKGIPSAIISGGVSIANTAEYYADKVNLGWGQLDTVNTINNIAGGDTADYAMNHLEGVELGGDLLGALIPGTLAIKGLKLAQAGLRISKLTGAATGLLNNTAEVTLLNRARVAMEGMDMVAARKARFLAAGAAGVQTGLEFAAFEAGAYAAMNQSPTYQSKSMGEAVVHSFNTGLLFGGLAAPFKYFSGMNKTFKIDSGSLEGGHTTLNATKDFVGKEITRTAEVKLPGAIGTEGDLLVSLMQALHTPAAPSLYADIQPTLNNISATRKTKLLTAVQEKLTDITDSGMLRESLYDMIKSGDAEQVVSVLGGLKKAEYATLKNWGDLTTDVAGRLKGDMTNLVVDTGEFLNSITQVVSNGVTQEIRHFTPNSNIASLLAADADKTYLRLPSTEKVRVNVPSHIANSSTQFSQYQAAVLQTAADHGASYIEFMVNKQVAHISVIGDTLINKIRTYGDSVSGAAEQGVSIFRNALTGETSSYAHINLATLEASTEASGKKVSWGKTFADFGNGLRLRLFKEHGAKSPVTTETFAEKGSSAAMEELYSRTDISRSNSLVSNAEHKLLVDSYVSGELRPYVLGDAKTSMFPKMTKDFIDFSLASMKDLIGVNSPMYNGIKYVTRALRESKEAADRFPKLRAAYEANKLYGPEHTVLSQTEKDSIYLTHIAETFNYLNAKGVHPAEAFASMGISPESPIVEKLLTSNYETAIYGNVEISKLMEAVDNKNLDGVTSALRNLMNTEGSSTAELLNTFSVQGSTSFRRIVDGTITTADIIPNNAVWTKLTYNAERTLNAWEQKGLAEWETTINAVAEERKMMASRILGNVELPRMDIANINFNDLDKSAGFIKSADAAYNSVLESASYVGKVVQGFTEKLRNTRAEMLLESEQRLRAAGVTSETAITLNAVIQRIKSSPTSVYLHRSKQAIVTEDYAIVFGIRPVAHDKMILDAQERLAKDPNAGIILWKDKLGIFQYFEHLEAVDAVYRDMYKDVSTMLNKPFKHVPKDSLYIPPYDLTETPHILLVVSPDDSKAILRATSANELQQKVKVIREANPEMRFIDQTDITAYKKFKNEYDYEAAFTHTTTTTTLKNNGVLHDIDIKSGFQEIDNINNWLSRKEYAITRGAVTAHYGNEFAEASMYSKITNPYNDSKLLPAGTRGAVIKEGRDAYTDVIKTALNLTDTEAYPYWKHTNTYVSELATKVSEKVWEIGHALRTDKMSVEDANEILTKYGVNDALYTPELWKLAAMPNMSNAAFEMVSKVRHGLSTAVLRLETMNSIVQSLAMPIMLSPAMSNALKNAKSIEEVPSQVGLYKNAFAAMFDKDLLELYRAKHLISPSISNAAASIDAAGQIMGATSNAEIMRLANGANNAMSKFVTIASKPTDYAEHMQRFVAVNIGHQLAVAQHMLEGSAEFWAYVNNFANKAAGNYTAGQRPALFQGIVGQVVGVFQTYQFNMMQQFAKYIAEGDNKALAMQLALQGTIFGATSMPAFNLINQHLIGEYTSDRSDIYSKTQELLPTRLGQTLLYGGASTMLNAALWTRGDVNPRTPTIVPILPQDMAMISMSVKAAQSLYDITDAMIKQGSAANPDLKISVGEAIAHAGINRPMSGIAEILIGARTSQGGKLDTNLLGNDIMSVGTAIRILGAKPLDESIALDAYQRQLKYKAKSAAKLNSIGEDLRTQLMGDGTIDPSTLDAFAEKYSKAGGDLKTFRQFYLRAMRDVSTPRAIQLLNSMKNSPYAEQYQMAMGSHFHELEGIPQEEQPQELPIEENIQQ